MKIKILPLILLLPFFVFSQTSEERGVIASFSNKEGNEALAKELRVEQNQRALRLFKYLKNNSIAAKNISADGIGKIELIDILPNGEKVFAKTYNAGAATTARATKLYNGGGLGLNIQGQGMIVGVWDGGSIRPTHQEFMVGGVSKISLMELEPESDNHATHVAGTIGAQGIVPSVRGVAFNSSIKSYDWTNDLSEMLFEAPALLVSNHSYGIGQLSSLWFYGAYDSRAKRMDEICFNNPYYLPVIAAGNDRNDTKTPASTQISTKSGYDMIFGHGNAKNVMTVAAVKEVQEYTGPASVVMSDFSSWGPSDDGRIKPDISMKGVSVKSTTAENDTSTASYNGTSMASPGVAGVVTLLQQYHNQLYSNFMRAATVKGLILHTADEAGFADGPDYEHGWGLINAEASAKIISDKNLSSEGSIIEENTLVTNAVYTKSIEVDGTKPLQISISWTDPAYATANTGTVDPAIKYLVNNLDVKVTSSGGDVFYPWKLQGLSNTYAMATNSSANDTDNFERVDIPFPKGKYTVTVSHKGSLTGGSQKYSLIMSGGNLAKLAVTDAKNSEEQLIVYPNPTKEMLFIKNNNLVEAKVSILDISGRVLSQKNINDGKIFVGDLPKGNYLLIYKDKKNREMSVKFIKE